MLSIRAERANIAGAIMYETMPNHFVLPLESLTTFASRAAFYRTIMRSI